MKKFVFGFVPAVLFLSLVLGGAEPKKPGKQPPPPAILKLAWLAGSWRMEKAGRVVDEQWMGPAGGVMLGMGRTVAKNRELEHEFLQIRQGPAGDLFYIAQSSGQKEATFNLTSLTDHTVVFENPEHDFPQKISYALKPDGTLLATSEGPASDGKPKVIEYLYQRGN